jgi:hypothetical protein
VKKPDASGEVINYFVVTRNRPALLRECLLSLAAGHESRLGSLNGKIHVVDDSTLSRFRGPVAAICRQKFKLPVVYLGQASHDRLIDEIKARTGRTARSLVGPLGRRGWNVHTARNFAWLYARVRLRETPLYCFLDDDIRVTPATYSNHHFTPDALNIIADNRKVLRSSSPVALGASFLGRQDVTMSRHVEIKSRELLKSSGAALPRLNHSFPMAVATTRAKIDAFDDIPSTGFLVTNYGAIASAHLSGFYNEDWLWARLLASEPGAKVARLKAAALHIGPAGVCSRATILFQEMGEILYDGLTDSLLQKPADEDSVQFVRHHLGQNALKIAADDHATVLTGRVRTIFHAVAALDHSRASGIASARRSLGVFARGIGETIRKLGDGEYKKYLAPFRAYLDEIPLWRAIVAD